MWKGESKGVCEISVEGLSKFWGGSYLWKGKGVEECKPGCCLREAGAAGGDVEGSKRVSRQEGRGRKGVSPAVDRRLATHKPTCAPSQKICICICICIFVFLYLYFSPCLSLLWVRKIPWYLFQGTPNNLKA